MTQQPAVKQPRNWAADLVDVFVYVVVLNLAVQFVPQILTESFTISLLAAVLLKVVLEIVLVVKGRARARLRAATSVPGRIGSGLLLWLVLVSSKVAVLELVGLVFGDRVVLGNFWSVTGLIVVLLLARFGVRQLLDRADRVAP